MEGLNVQRFLKEESGGEQERNQKSKGGTSGRSLYGKDSRDTWKLASKFKTSWKAKGEEAVQEGGGAKKERKLALKN